MKYTVQLDFFINKDIVRTDEEVKSVIEEIFSYSNCDISNIKVIGNIIDNPELVKCN